MKLFKKTLILFVVCFISDIIAYFLPFPFPGSVLAMIITFLLLLSGLVKVRQIEPVSDFLVKNMAFVFLPSTVSIVSYLDVFQSILWQFLLICIVTTFITFVCTAYSVKLTVYLINKRKEKTENA
ncbi:MAG: CidA/LrgA family protein [Clostridia bacterium]|nr:CidA/LrgA family protein [Clostridia bacterium]